jgi:hypothetical protein
MTSMTRMHAALAVLVALGLPGYSWLDGSGWLAWTMFSKSESYRLRIAVTDRDGRRTLVNPSALAGGANTQIGLHLSGAEHFRHAPMINSFAANLRGLGKLSCGAVPGAERARVALDSRRNLDAPVQTTSAEVSCR